MFLIAGINPMFKQLGMAEGECPACGAGRRLHIVRQSQALNLFFIPIFHFGGKYLATCSNCASVMELRKESGMRFEAQGRAVLGCDEMRIIKNNCAPKCPACGRRVSDDHTFCPGCGSRL